MNLKLFNEVDVILIALGSFLAGMVVAAVMIHLGITWK